MSVVLLKFALALGGLALLSACGGQQVQTKSTPSVEPSAQSARHIAVSADMLLSLPDLAGLPGAWCCAEERTLTDTLSYPTCPPGRALSDFFVSDEPVAGTPVPNRIGDTRSFDERIVEFATSADASACMSVLRQGLSAPGKETPLSIPSFGDETVASTLQTATTPAHEVEVRRGNIILQIGADDDDRTQSYVTVALAKLDRIMASASPLTASATAVSTP